jgi:hypothetical protein
MPDSLTFMGEHVGGSAEEEDIPVVGCGVVGHRQSGEHVGASHFPYFAPPRSGLTPDARPAEQLGRSAHRVLKPDQAFVGDL